MVETLKTQEDGMAERIKSLRGQVTNWQIQTSGQEEALGLELGEVVFVARNLREILDGLLNGDEEIPIILSDQSTFKLDSSLSSEKVEKRGEELMKIYYHHEGPDDVEAKKI